MVTKFHALPTGDKQECLPMETPGESAPGSHHGMTATRALQFSNLAAPGQHRSRRTAWTQSPLAYNLQKTLLPDAWSPRKGKGKGKNKMELEQTKTE